MANFIIDVDFIMSKRFEIEAESEAQAKAIFRQQMSENPYEYALQADNYVGYEVIDVTEE